ncbi:MAG: cob(I)yrinic acid a,c-diamide adenosyltransferase [Propionibacteriaceae bacterium]
MKGVPPTTTGPSTRELRRQPRLIVNTGEGKGKSTAAFGTALRGWSQGFSIGVFQFVKSAKWHVGERTALEELGHLHQATGVGGPVTWEVMGAGWTWLRSTADIDQAELARQGWDHVRALLAAQTHDLYVLDEFTYTLSRGWLDTDEVIDVLRNRPGYQHVIVTGRGAPAALVEAADLVTEMTKIKHPFDKGAKGQAGIEW